MCHKITTKYSQWHQWCDYTVNPELLDIAGHATALWKCSGCHQSFSESLYLQHKHVTTTFEHIGVKINGNPHGSLSWQDEAPNLGQDQGQWSSSLRYLCLPATLQGSPTLKNSVSGLADYKVSLNVHSSQTTGSTDSLSMPGGAFYWGLKCYKMGRSWLQNWSHLLGDSLFGDHLICLVRFLLHHQELLHLVSQIRALFHSVVCIRLQWDQWIPPHQLHPVNLNIAPLLLSPPRFQDACTQNVPSRCLFIYLT